MAILVNLFGTNAIGKSTRMTKFVEALEERGTPEKIKWITPKSKTKEVPIGIKLGNFFVIGKKATTGKWVGWDTADYPKLTDRLDLYKKILDTFPDVEYIFAEGYFNNRTKTLTMENLKKSGIKNIHYYFFLYNHVEEYLERCRQRTGDFSKTLEWAESCRGWLDNRTIENVYKFYKQNNEGLILSYDKDAPDDLLVIKYLKYLKCLKNSNIQNKQEEIW